MKRQDYEFSNSLNNNISGGGVTLNSLLLAVLAGCVSFGNTAEAADVLAPVPLTDTLLSDDENPADSSVSSNPVANSVMTQIANAVMPIANDANKGYKLTKVDKQGDDTIVKYEYDPSTHELKPVYYRLDLAKTTYGSTGETETYSYSLKDGVKKAEQQTGATITVHKDGLHEPIHHTAGQTHDAVTGDFIGNYTDNGGSQNTILNDKDAVMGDITGDFIGNGGSSTVRNEGTMGNITGNFIGNFGEEGSSALSNKATGKIGIVTGDFISNQGRGLENVGNNSTGIGKIEGIYGDFIANKLGAILNSGNITTIEGDFLANTAKFSGAGINNSGTIKNIGGSFQGNYSTIYGGAMYNTGEITDLKADFYGNHVADVNNYQHGSGGAIHNQGGTIENIEGNFGGNYIKVGKPTNPSESSVNYAQGGAIFNEQSSTIKHIKGDFVGNHVYSESYADGGAIHNSISTDGTSSGSLDYTKASKIGTIEGNFIGNYVELGKDSESYGQGGAIENLAGSSIESIKGDFIGNYIDGSVAAGGGAILNSQSATIGSIKGDFKGNYAKSKDGGNYAQGGAIYNSLDATMTSIEGDFFDNHVEGSVSGAGGAIYNNQAKIEKITGDFSNNYALGKNYVTGGAISNFDGTFGEIHGSFINNYAKSDGGRALGGAVFTNADINFVADNEQSVFSGNYVQVGNGEKESQAVYGGLTGTKVVKTGETIWRNGGRIPVYREVELDDPDVDINFTAQNNGAIAIYDKIAGDVTPDKEQYISDRFYETTEKDGTVTRHYLCIEEEDEYGNHYDYDPDADNVPVDNYAKNITDDGQCTVEEVERRLSINFKGDKTGKIYLNNNIEGKNKDGSQGALNVTLNGTNLILSQRDDVLNGNNLTLDSGSLSMINNTVGVSALESLTVKQDTDFIGDVDLKNRVMDRFESKTYGEHQGNVNVLGMNLLSDANPEDKVVAVYFAQPGLKNNVTNSLSMVPDEKYQNFTAYTPIYKYNFIYDKENQYDDKGDGGYFVFTRGDKYFRPDASTGSTGNPSDAFNPAVLASPVTTQAASSAINETFRYVFEHADAFTQMPEAIREAKIYSDRYALSTEFNENLGSLCYCHEEDQNKAGWVRPYTTFESVDYKNGPTVDAVTYGTLMGYDTNFRHLKHGWHNVGTGYIGYTGSHLSYGGNDTNFNGGLLGLTETFYKGNFWTALTASVGAGVADTRTMYGKEDAAMLMAGVASKSGYNFEFKEGKYILQPIWQMSYTFVNTFDYTNAAGVRIDSDPSHSIQLNPKMRFIMNTKNGWQPYASVGMVWNIITHGSTSADGVILPNMRVKPYVEYGVGLQRSWNDKFTAFGQVMLRNGGRTGVALTAGFRWALGREEDNENYHHHRNEKVQNNKTNTVSMQTGERKIIKQMSYAQKSAYKPQNTTRTTYRATIKQL